jgi:type II secretion system protein C
MPFETPPWLARLRRQLPVWPGASASPVQRIRVALAAGNVLAAGLLGWALAAAVGVALEMTVASLPLPPAAPARAADFAARRIQPVTAFDAIYTTNVFHARRSTAGTSAAAAGPVRLTLTGTFHIGTTAFALVVGPDGRTEGVYKIGQCLPSPDPEQAPSCPAGQGRLERVDHDRITVNFGGQRTVITMESEAAATAPPPNAAFAPKAPGQEPAPGSNAPFGQTRTGNTIEVHVPSTEVEKSFENFADIVRQALVVPFMKDGATSGFQIQRIQPGSVFQRIGLQNQDVIRGVNGQPITTADQALRLFSLFRNERHVTLDIDRGSESLTMSYMIE